MCTHSLHLHLFQSQHCSLHHHQLQSASVVSSRSAVHGSALATASSLEVACPSICLPICLLSVLAQTATGVSVSQCMSPESTRCASSTNRAAFSFDHGSDNSSRSTTNDHCEASLPTKEYAAGLPAKLCCIGCRCCCCVCADCACVRRRRSSSFPGLSDASSTSVYHSHRRCIALHFTPTEAAAPPPAATC